MGYTHYWYRKTLNASISRFSASVRDFRKIIPELEKLGIQLADGHGVGEPEINVKRIWFNGSSKCGHAKNEEIVIPWPSREASGVAKGFDGNASEGEKSWFAGALIDKRCCDGDCSYETFHFPRAMERRPGIEPVDHEPKGYWFDCCKTAFRPYDLAVNCFLIVAKRHFGEWLKVYSDGETQHWADGRMLCQKVLGYGIDFELDPRKEES